MAMAFLDHKGSIKLRRLCPNNQLARLRPEPHRAPFRRHFRLFVEHGARRAFPIGASHVDESKLFLGVAGERRQLQRVVQSELCAKPAKPVKELDGFGVGHRLRAKPKDDRMEVRRMTVPAPLDLIDMTGTRAKAASYENRVARPQ